MNFTGCGLEELLRGGRLSLFLNEEVNCKEDDLEEAESEEHRAGCTRRGLLAWDGVLRTKAKCDETERQ